MTRIVALLFILAIGLIVGCNSDAKTASRPGVLDVSKSPAPSAEPVAATPTAEPAMIAYSAPTPVSGPIATPTAEPTAPLPAAHKTYTVRKGDTLFSIAKTNYGTGRDWQKIASANPGLSPTKMKAGQQIVIP